MTRLTALRLSVPRLGLTLASPPAAAAVRALGTRAYTIGQDIHFGAGHYDPTRAGGRHLLVHEIAHTVQQRIVGRFRGAPPSKVGARTLTEQLDGGKRHGGSATHRVAPIGSAGEGKPRMRRTALHAPAWALCSVGLLFVIANCGGDFSAPKSDQPLESASSATGESSDARATLEQVRTRFQHALPAGDATLLQRVRNDSTDDRDVVRPAFFSLRVEDNTRAKKVKLKLPARASESLAISSAASDVAISVRLEGLGAAPAQAADGYMIYRDVLGKDSHLLQRVQEDGVEDFLILPQRREPTLTYRIKLERGMAGIRHIGDTIEFLDAEGTPRLRVARPGVVDSNQNPVAAHFRVEDCAVDTDPAPPWGRSIVAPGASECTLRMSWDDQGVAYPLLVDPVWSATGNMVETRSMHPAVLLNTGKVLVVGGFSSPIVDRRRNLNTCELYDPTTGTWAATGSMSSGRRAPTARLLPSGKVLAVGGLGGVVLASTEVYDPATGTWAAGPSMRTPRWDHRMVSIGNKFLVTGGFRDGGDTTTASAEIYDPVTNAWTATPNMVSARILHTAITLLDGRVLVAGGTAAWGSCDATTQIYNIATNSWTSGPSLSTARCYASADLLPDGKVFVAGGSTWGPVVSSTELFDPATNTWTASAPMTEGRYQHTSAVLPDGRLVLAGGQKQWGVATATTERFYADVHDGVQWRSLGDLPAARYAHSMTPLTPTLVLLAGGYNNSTTTADAQILNLDEAPRAPGHSGGPWTSPSPPTNHPARTRPLFNAPALVDDPCLPTHSCPTVHAADFLTWAMASVVDEEPFIQARMTQQRNNPAVASAFCNEAFSSQQQNWGRSLIALVLLGSMRSPHAETCLITFANQPLPTTGTFVSLVESEPASEPIEATSLAMLETVAVDGIALLTTSTGDAQVRHLAAQHPSALVRSEAMRAYIANKGDAGRLALMSLVRPEEQILLDRFEDRDTSGSSSTYDARLAAYLALHPKAAQPPVARKK